MGAHRILGPNFKPGIQKQLGTTVDGVMSGQWLSNKPYFWATDGGVEWTKTGKGVGSDMVLALQKKVGCKVYPEFCGVQARQMSPGTIKRHQQWLIDHGISCGPDGADGYNGPNTSRAVAQAIKRKLYAA